MAVIILLLSFVNLFSPQIKIENAWMRPANQGMNAALYFDMNNPTTNPEDYLPIRKNLINTISLWVASHQGSVKANSHYDF